MNRHASMIFALPTTLLLLNTASGEEIIKDKPTPSRAEGAPLSYAYGRDYSTSDVTKVVVIRSGTPAADLITKDLHRSCRQRAALHFRLWPRLLAKL